MQNGSGFPWYFLNEYLRLLREIPNTAAARRVYNLTQQKTFFWGGGSLQSQCANKVYVLDPDEAVRDGLRVLLDSFDIEVNVFPDGESFLEEAASEAQGCALIESQLPDINGLALLSRLRQMGNSIPVLLLTSSPDEGLARQALERGAACVIRKPLAGEHLLQHLASLLHPVPPGLAAFRPLSSWIPRIRKPDTA